MSWSTRACERDGLRGIDPPAQTQRRPPAVDDYRLTIMMIAIVFHIPQQSAVAMGLPRLQSCCGLLDLKTGNIVLGSLNALLSLSLVIVLSAAAAGLSSVEAAEGAAGELGEGAGELGEDEQAALTGAWVMAVMLVFMFLAKLAFDVAFVVGVVTERAGIIKAYFVMWVVFSILSVSTFFLNVPYFSAGTVLVEVLYIGVNIYAVLLSYSFYKLLNEREEV